MKTYFLYKKIYNERKSKKKRPYKLMSKMAINEASYPMLSRKSSSFYQTIEDGQHDYTMHSGSPMVLLVIALNQT